MFHICNRTAVYLKEIGSVCNQIQGLEPKGNPVTCFLIISFKSINQSGARDLLECVLRIWTGNEHCTPENLSVSIFDKGTQCHTTPFCSFN
jgi:hypothetical protein